MFLYLITASTFFICYYNYITALICNKSEILDKQWCYFRYFVNPFSMITIAHLNYYNIIIIIIIIVIFLIFCGRIIKAKRRTTGDNEVLLLFVLMS